MTMPTHVIANVGAFLVLGHIFGMSTNEMDLWLVIGANLIDLDHLFSRPIYHPRRNPFKVHFFHRNWKWVTAFSIGMLFLPAIFFLGIGILVHFILDYLYIKREGI